MLNILVADDEGIERMIVKKILTDYYQDQCTVFTVINGRQAVDVSQNQDIQIAILDIAMPGINGIEAAKEIKKLQKKLKSCIRNAALSF